MIYYVLIVLLLGLLFLIKSKREGMTDGIIKTTREKIRSNIRNARKTTEGYISNGKKVIRKGKKIIGIE